jgi:dienelactone hydrolase
MRLRTALLIVASLAASVSMARVVGQNVEYTVNGKVMEGYLAAPTDSESARPAVMIVHDWNGIDAYEESRADQLAQLGYVAFCADIYGKGVRPKNAQESGAEAAKYYLNNALMRERTSGALKFLAGNDIVQKNNIAAIGYCFGGTTVLDMARAGMPVKGVVSFHGGLGSQNRMPKGAFKGKVLVLHGADDPLVPKADIDAFKREMETAGAPYEFIAYPGAVHSFTVPGPKRVGNGATGYDEEADKQSFAKMLEFFKSIF